MDNPKKDNAYINKNREQLLKDIESWKKSPMTKEAFRKQAQRMNDLRRHEINEDE